MATRLPVRFLLLLRPRATAAAGWSAGAVALVALVVVHSRFYLC
jgi:hypothetical protein